MPEITERLHAFWDIESIQNIFMFAIFTPKNGISDKNQCMYFYLYDDGELTDEFKKEITDYVFEANSNDISPDDTDVHYYNLANKSVNELLLRLFNVSDKSFFGDESENRYKSIVQTINNDITSPLTMPYMIGYNTTGYDCVMMASYFNETWGFDAFNNPSFMPTTAKTMREFNNLLFNYYKEDMQSALKNNETNIYQNILKTGLFLDAAKINDKVFKMPLKRIMGMLGMDIFEDEDVASGKPLKTKEQIKKLFAYNLSDDIKLYNLWQHPAYAAQFDLKCGLIKAYPDLVWTNKTDRNGNAIKDVNGEPIKVLRETRMKVDDTSAKFAAKVLCPDGYLNDIRAVSYEYPKGSGRNILKETREWAESKFGKESDAIKELNVIFDWYAEIEGKNFDDSEHYMSHYLLDGLMCSNIRSIPHGKTCVPYFDKNGKPTRTYVNFGIGGIHGAEYNKDLYDEHVKEYLDAYADVRKFISKFTPDELKALKPTVEIDGVKYKRSNYVTIKKDKTVAIKWPKEPKLFKLLPSGNWKLNEKYTYTSDDETDHEDFTSYYPSMLMNMKAYENPMLGEDRYVQQFDNKTLFGKYMKDENRSKDERRYYKTLREGTKLILNSASGASDTAYDNSIRMNNVIISMRIIGQLFTWRIGQAQTLEGFKITSTNTDGLYAVCDKNTRERCREILERESKTINVGIEPEEMRLISKDANNRIEVSLDGKLLSSSGGDTACPDGPVPTKALSHPAIIDRLMVDYMIKYGVDKPFDEMAAMELLDNLVKTEEPKKMLNLYQQIINSSEGKCRYIFAEIDGKIKTFQNNNRIFAIKCDGAHLYIANGWDKGKSEHNAVADEVLSRYGIDPKPFNNTRILKIPKIPSEQNFIIYNHDINNMPENVMRSFIANIDNGHYISLLASTYDNWCNASEKSENDEEESE